MTPAASRPPSGRRSPGTISTLFLVRHGKAANRERWTAPDSERPLTKRGFGQAGVIAGHLVGLLGRTPSRAFSSPAVRCVQTIEPLAAACQLEVIRAEWLNEGSDGDQAFDQLRKLAVRLDPPSGAGGPVVACSHGDVIWTILERLARLGVDIGPGPDAPKGGVWIIGTTTRTVLHAQLYVPDVAKGEQSERTALT